MARSVVSLSQVLRFVLLALVAGGLGHVEFARADLKEFPNRHEGTLNRAFTDGDLQLVSFVGRPAAYPMDGAMNLDVWFFGSAKGAKVRAQELAPTCSMPCAARSRPAGRPMHGTSWAPGPRRTYSFC